MAKNKNKTAIKALAVAAALSIPVAGVASANTVKVSVIVNPVASVEVESEEIEAGIRYTAFISTNSTTGYNLYVSEDGEDWEILKTIDHYPSEEEKIVTSTSTKADLQFKAEPRE